ncbi:MFS transporter, partial [Novosphingobium sp. 1949]
MNDPTATSQEKRLFGLLVGVYLGGGAITGTVNLLVPRFELTMHLDHAQALLVHLAFYSSYLLFALPVTFASVALGYMRSIAVGLAIMAAGCAGFALAHAQGRYAPLLLALLVISLGVTFLQISGNAVTTVFKRSGAMASRYTLLQGFNSVGTVLGPLVGAPFILAVHGGAVRPAVPFIAAGAVFLVLGGLFARNAALAPPLPRAPSDGLETGGGKPLWRRLARLATNRSMMAGTLTIFCYVGAEVTLATLAVEYLMRADTLGLGAVSAGNMVSLYWAAAMVGRFLGAGAVRALGTARLLGLAALGAM